MIVFQGKRLGFDVELAWWDSQIYGDQATVDDLRQMVKTNQRVDMTPTGPSRKVDMQDNLVVYVALQELWDTVKIVQGAEELRAIDYDADGRTVY